MIETFVWTISLLLANAAGRSLLECDRELTYLEKLPDLNLLSTKAWHGFLVCTDSLIACAVWMIDLIAVKIGFGQNFNNHHCSFFVSYSSGLSSAA